jgi:hypothetical protein
MKCFSELFPIACAIMLNLFSKYKLRDLTNASGTNLDH